MERLQASKQVAAKAFNYAVKQVTRLFLYLITHPVKSALFAAKVYLGLILFTFCLVATFSSFAQETVPGNPIDTSQPPVPKEGGYSYPWVAGVMPGPDHNDIWDGVVYYIDGEPYIAMPLPDATGMCQADARKHIGSNPLITADGSYRWNDWTPLSTPGHERNRLFLDCSIVYRRDDDTQKGLSWSHSWLVDRITGQVCPAGTVEVDGQCYLHSQCPPEGFPYHTEPDGPNCVKAVDCEALSGADAGLFVYRSSERVTDTSTLQCVSGNSNYTEGFSGTCAVTGGSGWIEQQGSDGGWIYSPINATFSGYHCDQDGNPDEPAGHCVAYDSGGVKGVSCPDGTSMSVPWGAFEAVEDAFLNFRTQASQNIGDNANRIDQLEANQVTPEQVINQITSDPDLLGQLQGEDGTSCTVTPTTGGSTITCGEASAFVANGSAGAAGADGVDGADGEDGQSCTLLPTQDGVDIICPDATAKVMHGDDGKDGDNCTTQALEGGDVQITCGETVATLNGVDEQGLVDAINAQTDRLEEALTYQGTTPTNNFGMNENLANAIGEPNDWQTRNFGTVIEAAVTEMQSAPVYVALDGFFDVSFGGSCPTYSASVDFLNTTLVFDQWCSSVMDQIWPWVSSVIILVFSYFAFREAIL